MLYRQQWIAILCGAIWLGTVASGLAVLWRYEGRAGVATAAPAVWPEESRIPRAPSLPTLVMFAHPRCPCTRASIGELNALLAQCDGRVRVHVLFYEPRGFSGEWTQTDLWRDAAAIPGVAVYRDEDGSEARRFGAETSGFVALYGVSGRLAFSGGITDSRGHAGDNAGRSAIVAILNSATPKLAATPVFGCSIFGGKSTCIREAATCIK